MPRVDQRQGVWFYGMLVVLAFGGLSALGYFTTYDINCGGFGLGKTWHWDRLPPGFTCYP